MRSTSLLLLVTTAALGYQAAVRVSPGNVEVLKAVGSFAPHVVGLFREPIGFKRTANGDYYVFDRRGHTVYAVSPDGATATKLVQIGAEEGRLIEPSAFDVAVNGSFAVADAPNARERVQIFDAAGVRTGGFILPGRGASRVVLGQLALNGVATLSYNGKSLLMSHPETGWLLTEYGSLGTPIRSIGQLRKTGHEADRDLHFALNSGIPIADPAGGFYFVFIAGQPAFRKYDAKGDLVFERVIQGREIDPVIAAIPDRWPRRAAGELPLVAPAVRTAAVDRSGRLWVSFVLPYTYIYDGIGEKIRTVQFRGAGIIAPSSLWFDTDGRVLVTPGCYEFAP
ncbi:MAG TPA: hypothetical protein VFP85_13830 [Vicinamibacterales bacterium]|nr:hypothetical protein [Vicinamibacterales bacterium]